MLSINASLYADYKPRYGLNENKMNSLKIVVVFYLIFTLSLNRKKVGREQEF